MIDGYSDIPIVYIYILVEYRDLLGFIDFIILGLDWKSLSSFFMYPLVI